MIRNLNELVQGPEAAGLRRMRHDCLRSFEAAVKSVDAGSAVRDHLRIRGRRLFLRSLEFDLDAISAVRMIALGKASLPMARALLEAIEVEEGLVVSDERGKSKWPRVEVIRGGHPEPDEGSLVAGRRALEIAGRCGASDILFVLISGGGSSLLEDTDIPLADLQRATSLMFQSGMDIVEENIVRKHLSNIKGGQLARAASSQGSALVSLIVSDVVGDLFSSIASGPTAPDDSTFEEAIGILKDYGIWDDLPSSVRERCTKGLEGEVAETPGPEEPAFRRIHNMIVARNIGACAAAAKEADRRGYRPLLLGSQIQGEAREVGRVLASIARSVEDDGSPVSPPAALICGGETTVRIRGGGVGGRNQELVLAAVPHLEGRRIVLLSCGTDGRDGLTDAAGAIVDGESLKRSLKLDMKPLQYLKENDSYTFFRKLGDAVVTGPTGTNVMDLQIVLIGGPETPG